MNLELRELRKDFGLGAEIIKNISLSMEVTSLAVIGPSGGGKSTLLRLIGGLIAPTSGQILLNGSAIGDSEASLLRHRRQIGFVFQSRGLFHHMTGLQNITIPLTQVYGFTRGEAQDRALELLERFGLAEDRHKKPHELSGGQQQRIAIARAVAARPSLLLLDEPTSALDPELTSDVLDMIHELVIDGLHILVVTHEMGFAQNACEQALFLYQGQLMEYGRSSDLFQHPQTSELKDFLKRVLEWNP